MKLLSELFSKESKLTIGLMSGTSLDGIDAALVRIKGNGTHTSIEDLCFVSRPFPSGLKEFILRNSRSGTSDVADIARLNFLLAQLYADAVFEVCRSAGVDHKEIDLIGSHGQTIQHLPSKAPMFGKEVAATLQVGDPSVLAKLTGIVTVGDFRVGDVALGGQGAPLVPYFDYLLFTSDTLNRGLLNIGGIANITYLKKGCRPNEVLAFDTGPGNMLIDQVAKTLFDMDYDKGGEIARTGVVQGDIIDALMTDEFVRASPPKSTGRERYGESFVSDILERYRDRKKEDILASVAEFTGTSVYANYLLFLKSRGDMDELIVSGGGAHNRFVTDSLRRLFNGTTVRHPEELGVSADSKEALCFAVLANETISGNPANLPGVTGASRDTVIGKICLP